MPSLLDLQRAFSRALLDPARSVPPFAAIPAAGAEERLAVYRRAFRANYRNALAASYPVVRRLLGADRFEAAVDAFVMEYPPASTDLNVYGDAFGTFLAGRFPEVHLACVPDLAALEWALDESAREADAPLRPDEVLAALAALSADALPVARLDLAPSCRLVASPWPLLAIWRAHQRGDDPAGAVPPASSTDGGDALLVRRDADGIAIERLARGAHAWLVALASGSPLAAALDRALEADRAFDVGPELAARIGDGTLAGVRVGGA